MMSTSVVSGKYISVYLFSKSFIIREVKKMVAVTVI